MLAVSGSVPEEPVVDRNTGHLFEKRLVQKYIQVQTPPQIGDMNAYKPCFRGRTHCKGLIFNFARHSSLVLAGNRTEPYHWRDIVNRWFAAHKEWSGAVRMTCIALLHCSVLSARTETKLLWVLQEVEVCLAFRQSSHGLPQPPAYRASWASSKM